MIGLKIYNGLNGLLYTVYGLVGVFMPSIALEANALEATSVHGTHSIRALWGAFAVMGTIILWLGFKPASARKTTMIVALVSVGLAVSRLLGIVIDGTEGMLSDQYGPLMIEISMAVIGLFLCSRTKPETS